MGGGSWTATNYCSYNRSVGRSVSATTGEMFYDLDYDTQLQRAIEIVNSQDFSELLENTKTLKEIEDLALETDTEN